MCVSSKILKKRSNLKQKKTICRLNFSSSSWSFKLLQAIECNFKVNYHKLIRRKVSFFLINVVK